MANTSITCSTEMGTPCDEVFPLLHIKPAPSCSYMRDRFQHCCVMAMTVFYWEVWSASISSIMNRKCKKLSQARIRTQLHSLQPPLLVWFHTCHWKIQLTFNAIHFDHSKIRFLNNNTINFQLHISKLNLEISVYYLCSEQRWTTQLSMPPPKWIFKIQRHYKLF